MRRRRLAITFAAALGSALALGPVGPAAGQSVPVNAIIAPLNASTNGFLPDQVSIKEGGSLDFYSLDLTPHDVTIDARDAEGHEIYHSEEISYSETLAKRSAYPVKNVEQLPAGTYAFFCSVHSSSAMRGTLTIEPAGGPLG